MNDTRRQHWLVSTLIVVSGMAAVLANLVGASTFPQELTALVQSPWVLGIGGGGVLLGVSWMVNDVRVNGWKRASRDGPSTPTPDSPAEQLRSLVPDIREARTAIRGRGELKPLDALDMIDSLVVRFDAVAIPCPPKPPHISDPLLLEWQRFLAFLEPLADMGQWDQARAVLRRMKSGDAPYDEA